MTGLDAGGFGEMINKVDKTDHRGDIFTLLV